MKKWLPSLLVALFAAVPTSLLVADYLANERLNWALLIIWAIAVVLAIAFTAGGGTDEQ